MKKIKAMLPFLAVVALSYYFLPLLIKEFGSAMTIFFVGIPLICLFTSIAYGINNSFNILYAVFVIILYAPVFLILPLTANWILAIIYGVVALAGNAVGMIFFKRNVRIKNVEKYGRYLLIAIAGSYIVAVIASAIMMAQMTQITYNATAFGALMREDIIDFEANTAQRKYNDSFRGAPNNHENSISTAEKFKIKIICSLSLFPLWPESYYNPYVMDGDQYNIKRTYGDNESAVYGSNAYPLTYRLVMAVIEDALK